MIPNLRQQHVTNVLGDMKKCMHPEEVLGRVANNVGFSAARCLKAADPVDQCTVGLKQPHQKEVVNYSLHNDIHLCYKAAHQGCEARS